MQQMQILTKMLERSTLSIEDIEAKLKDENNFDYDSTEDLKDMLNGLVLMHKIQKDGNKYAGLEVAVANPEERSTAKKQRSHDGDIKYPDYVATEKDKVQFLLSQDAPLLERARSFMYFEENKIQTGREIYDILNSSTINHEVCICGDKSKNCNVTIYHRTSTSARGFGISIREGKYRIYLSRAGKDNEKLFNDYDEVKEWIAKNL